MKNEQPTTDLPKTIPSQIVGSGDLLAVCKNCRHWGEALVWFEWRNGVDVRFCQHAMVCQPNYGERSNRKMTASGVFTMDEGGCTGEFCTGPDFGCRHFSAQRAR